MVYPVPQHAFSATVGREALHIAAHEKGVRVSDVWEVRHVFCELWKCVHGVYALLLNGG